MELGTSSGATISVASARSASVSAAEKRSPRLRRTGLEVGVAELGALHQAEHAGGLRPDEGPPLRGERLERGAGVGREVGRLLGEDGRALLGRDGGVEGGVDRRERLGEDAELAARQGRRGLGPVVVLRRDGVAGRLRGPRRSRTRS